MQVTITAMMKTTMKFAIGMVGLVAQAIPGAAIGTVFVLNANVLILIMVISVTLFIHKKPTFYYFRFIFSYASI